MSNKKEIIKHTDQKIDADEYVSMIKEKIESNLKKAYRQQGRKEPLKLVGTPESLFSWVLLYGDLRTLQEVLAEYNAFIDEECLKELEKYCGLIVKRFFRI